MIKTAKIAYLTLLTCFISTAEDPKIVVREANEVKFFEQEKCGIDFVDPQMLYADFWIQQEDSPDTILMTVTEIAAYNTWNILNTKAFTNFAEIPDTLTMAELTSFVEAISGAGGASLQYPTENFYHPDGRKLIAADYAKYQELLNLAGIGDCNQVRFGLVVNREIIRRFPTFDEVRNKSLSPHVNMFAESCAYPGEAVAILHESTDKKWFLIRKHDYLAWIPNSAVAVGARSTVLNYVNPVDFLVVTDPQIKLEYNPDDARISERVYDMGCVLPLSAEIPDTVGSRRPFGVFVITVPVRDGSGNLELVPALLPRASGVNWGFLPFTKRNLLTQIFKFIGERYGWADTYNGRDCSGIIRNTFSVFGIRMARNGTEQNLQMKGSFFDFSAIENYQEKLLMLELLTSGDLMRFPGHTTMYLGMVNRRSYMIHDTSGIEYRMEDGSNQNIPFWGVGVTPLIELSGGEYFLHLQNVKRINLNK